MKRIRSGTLTVAKSLVIVSGAALATLQPANAQGTAAFEATVKLQGISFTVASPNTASGNTLTIVPKGLKLDNSPIELPVDGIVTAAEVGDLNVDGSPEIYVVGHGNGADRKGILIAYSANRSKSLSGITVPPLAAKAATGYQGHDEFAVVENVVVRRFPIYSSDGKPSGKRRQVQYKLKPGEASWKLVADRTIEY